MSWASAQRAAGIAKRIEEQRRHWHREGEFRFLGRGLGDRPVYSLECVACGAVIALYGWRPAAGGWDLQVTWHCQKN